MRKIKSILLSVLLIVTATVTGQTFTPDMNYQDSLVGFNTNAVISSAKQSNVTGSELRNYVRQRQADFIKQKYYPVKTVTQTPIQPSTKHIGGGAQVMVAPCVNEGFESRVLNEDSKGLVYA